MRHQHWIAAAMFATACLPGGGDRVPLPRSLAEVAEGRTPCSSSEPGASGVIWGVVTEGDSVPKRDAQVYFPALNCGSLTDSLGQYLIPGVGSGKHELWAELIGYRSAKKPVEVRNDTVRFDFSLDAVAIRFDDLIVTGLRLDSVALESLDLPFVQVSPWSAVDGDWIVETWDCPRICAMSRSEAASWIGTEMSYSPAQARVGNDFCRPPEYETTIVSAETLGETYGLGPPDLGAYGDRVWRVEVRCAGTPWTGPGGLIHAWGSGSGVTTWDGIVFTMSRSR